MPALTDKVVLLVGIEIPLINLLLFILNNKDV